MQITFRYFLNATYCPKVNWQSRLKNPSSILKTIENWELRRKDWGSRIKDCGLRDCQLTFAWYYIFIKFQSTAFLLQKKFIPNNMVLIQSKEIYFIISFTFAIFRLKDNKLLLLGRHVFAWPTSVLVIESAWKKQQWKMQQPNFTVCDDNFWNKMKLAYFWHFQKGHMSYYTLFFPKYVHTSS